MNFDQIKAHPLFPFREFRTDDLAFLRLELYWAELFREIIGAEPNGASRLTAWCPAASADREDGNPILSVIDRTARPIRAVRIVQRFNDHGLPEVDLAHLAPVRFRGDAYVPFVPDIGRDATDDDGTTPVEELLISSDVTDACERLARGLIGKWCVDRVSPAHMQQMLDAYWQRVRENLIELP